MPLRIGVFAAVVASWFHGPPNPVTRAAGSEPTPSAAKDEAAAFLEASPSCPKSATRCFGIALHVVAEDGRAVQSPEWLRDHLDTANELFAPIGVGFEVARAELRSDAPAVIHSREQRDRLGREEHSAEVIHVYVVRQLDDVDAEGQIRGVHWRDRTNTKRRWVILSSIANRYVLAHELGHFFGLPHSSYHESIMNKRPRAIATEDLRFVQKELDKMAKRRDEMVSDGTLAPRSR